MRRTAARQHGRRDTETAKSVCPGRRRPREALQDLPLRRWPNPPKKGPAAWRVRCRSPPRPKAGAIIKARGRTGVTAAIRRLNTPYSEPPVLDETPGGVRAAE
jgi:hypothetical protein